MFGTEHVETAKFSFHYLLKKKMNVNSFSAFLFQYNRMVQMSDLLIIYSSLKLIGPIFYIEVYKMNFIQTKINNFVRFKISPKYSDANRFTEYDNH